MAVNSVSSSSSLYGSRNVISGLASGMDTESMIQNAVSGYSAKITKLQQQQTQVSWQQSAYRNVTNTLIEFSQKYTNYTSSSNLMSSSFFGNASKVNAQGKYADLVSATGKSSSDIRLNGVSQLATATRFTTSAGVASKSTDGLVKGSEVDLADTSTKSLLSGTINLTYGLDQKVSVTIAESELYDDNGDVISMDDYAALINKKLEDKTLGSKAASEYIEVVANGDKLEFNDKGVNGVKVSSLTGSLKTLVGDQIDADNPTKSLDFSGVTTTETITGVDKISGKSMTINYNGTSKTFKIATKEEIDAYKAEHSSATDEDALTALMQEKVDQAFGKSKIKVSNEASDHDKLQMQFEVSSGTNNTLQVLSSANTTMGLSANATSFVNTNATLGSLGVLDGLAQNSDGTYTLKINDVEIGNYSADTKLSTLMADIDKSDVGFKVNYSGLTNSFSFAANETGSGHTLAYEDDGLAAAIFGKVSEGTMSEGQNAIAHVTVNGMDMQLERAENTFNIDGQEITISGTFNTNEDGTFNFLDGAGKVDKSKLADAVTFKSSADTEKVSTAIKSFVEDLNAILTMVRSGYSTQPERDSSGNRYMPLSEDDQADMSESAIEKYETKAKQGLLYGDQDLSSMYSSVINGLTANLGELRAIGITTSFNKGLTQLEIDENKLTAAIENDIESVMDAFAGSSDGSNKGIANAVKDTFDKYAKTTGAQKGILIQKAGSEHAATSMLSNTLKTKYDDFQVQIAKWQAKMADKVDFYTSKFTSLEQLVSQMNSQSNTLYGMTNPNG